VLQPNGKIIVSGFSRHWTTVGLVQIRLWDLLVVARFNQDGTPDLSFGNGGIVTKGRGTDTDYVPTEVVVGEDGSISVAGWYREYKLVNGPLTVATSFQIMVDRFLGN
jgi:hypothetical protein